MKNLIFAYGTLRQGFLNFDRCLAGRCTVIGTGRTKEKFSLFFDSSLPVASKHPTSQLCGDLFEVDDDTLATLDRLEQHPRWYCREEVEVEVDGKAYTAWLYFMRRLEAQIIDGVIKTTSDKLKIVETGDFYDVPNVRMWANAFGMDELKRRKEKEVG